MTEHRTYKPWKRERILDLELVEKRNIIHILIKTKNGHAPLFRFDKSPPWRRVDTFKCMDYFLTQYSYHLNKFIKYVWSGEGFVFEELRDALKGRYIWYRRPYQIGGLK